MSPNQPDNIQKDIGYHNLTFKELLREARNSNDEFTRALLEKFLTECKTGWDFEIIKEDIRKNLY